MASLPCPCDNHQSTGGRSERTQCQTKMTAWNSCSYVCTRALHSFRSFAYCRADFTVIPLLPKATFTPTIQPNLGLPRTRHQLTSASNTLLAIRYSSILSICPNDLNTFWSALLANSLSIPASPTHLFIPNSIHSRHYNCRGGGCSCSGCTRLCHLGKTRSGIVPGCFLCRLTYFYRCVEDFRAHVYVADVGLSVIPCYTIALIVRELW